MHASIQIASSLFPNITGDKVYNPALSKYGHGEGNVVLAEMIANFLTIALAIASIILLIFIVIGGIEWLLAGGEKASVENARNRITNAIIGLIVVALTVAITKFIGNFLGIDILRLTLPIPTV